MVSALDPSNSVKKRLWCIDIEKKNVLIYNALRSDMEKSPWDDIQDNQLHKLCSCGCSPIRRHNLYSASVALTIEEHHLHWKRQGLWCWHCHCVSMGTGVDIVTVSAWALVLTSSLCQHGLWCWHCHCVSMGTGVDIVTVSAWALVLTLSLCQHGHWCWHCHCVSMGTGVDIVTVSEPIDIMFLGAVLYSDSSFFL